MAFSCYDHMLCHFIEIIASRFWFHKILSIRRYKTKDRLGILRINSEDSKCNQEYLVMEKHWRGVLSDIYQKEAQFNTVFSQLKEMDWVGFEPTASARSVTSII